MNVDRLKSIGVVVEEVPAGAGNALPVLHEVLHALRRLSENGDHTVIDLRSIPFGPGDEQALLETLGEGEISATLDALGRTEIRETRYHGVWVVDYLGPDGERVGLQIEVTEVPGLLRTPAGDIGDAVAALQEMLAAAEDTSSQENNR
jgi:hydrogenase-1 operon protein HyaF